MKKGSQFGAGEGIDRDASVFQSNAVLPPNEKGVLLTIGLDIPNVGRRIIVARAPDTPHGPRLTNHGSGSEESIYTQAEIVDAFLKNGNSANYAAGKWSEWAEGNFREMISRYSAMFAKKMKAFVDESVKRSRREWISALRSKKAQSQIRPLKEKIRATYQEQREHSRLAKEKVPDFDAVFGSGSIVKIESAAKARQEFKKTRTMHRLQARSLRQEHRVLLSQLKDLKATIVKRGRSKELAEEIADTIEAQRIAEDSMDRKGAREQQDRLAALTMPFQIGANIGIILNATSKELGYELQMLFIGMKAPPLAKHTSYNRRWRGYDDTTTPLMESGEFAKSIYTEVI